MDRRWAKSATSATEVGSKLISVSGRIGAHELTRKKIPRKSRALEDPTLGLHVVPMHTIEDGHCSCEAVSDCPRPGKHPITRHGVNDATTDNEQIVNWWTDHPHANIGVATGRGRDLGARYRSAERRHRDSATARKTTRAASSDRDVQHRWRRRTSDF